MMGESQQLDITTKYFFIINPTAKRGRVLPVWGRVKSYLEEYKIPHDFAFSTSTEHVSELAASAAATGYTVVGVGGDGTLSGIVGALADKGLTFGIIPAGTGNDFARTFNIPLDPTAALQVILSGNTVCLDLGLANGRYFANVVGAGLDAEVAADANRIFKKISGPLGYMMALLRQLAIYRPKKIKLTVDGSIHYVNAWLVTVANARFYGGGMEVAPQADPQDGLLDIVVVHNIHRLRFLQLFPLVYRGQHINNEAVRTWQGTNVAVESEELLSVHADGDLHGTTPLAVTIKAGAVQLFVPPVG
ncbi:MAG: diacylglycerol kinase family lipid kinase [Firmicutes bacterium]|nr:diacylglycerol kinase family lipid kinase [Bacillota bacterium]